MWNIDYNIHDLLKVKVRGNTRFDLGRNLKYSFFESSANLKNPDIILNIGKFRPANENCDFISHKYYVKDNYIYCKDKGRNTKWEVEINGFEDGQTTINFNGKGSSIKGILFPSFLAQEFLVPIIEYKLAQVNHFLIHAGAVSKDFKAYAFAGRPGSYKTTLIMDLIRRENCSFLSDDRIIMGKTKILPFPISLFLFNFMVNYMDTERRTIKHEICLFKRLLLKHQEEVLPISHASTLNSLVFLSMGNTNRIDKINISLEEALNKLVINNRSEYVSYNPNQPSGSFHKYMLAYSLINPDNMIVTYWNNLYNNLKLIIRNLPIFEIKMPYEYSPNMANAIISMADESNRHLHSEALDVRE
jgi:hypothetical protein